MVFLIIEFYYLLRQDALRRLVFLVDIHELFHPTSLQPVQESVSSKIGTPRGLTWNTPKIPHQKSARRKPNQRKWDRDDDKQSKATRLPPPVILIDNNICIAPEQVFLANSIHRLSRLCADIDYHAVPMGVDTSTFMDWFIEIPSPWVPSELIGMFWDEGYVCMRGT